jgi:lipoprotein-anchoring transpeptidase ErfK/SrfK
VSRAAASDAASPADPASQDFQTTGFQGSDTLEQVRTGATQPIGPSSQQSDAVQLVQTALFSLGYVATTGDVDGVFGPKTGAALSSFQTDQSLSDNPGLIDAATISALDAAAAQQIADLSAKQIAPGTRRDSFTLTADIADPSNTRIYVLDTGGQPVACYLTSPGTADHATEGTNFTIAAVLPRQPWIPPKSDWAKNLTQQPPGIHNPMGILKLSLGAYAEYFHGIPFTEEAELGQAASHGCLRMSGANVLEFHELYAELGSKVTINRDSSVSADLQSKASAAGIAARPTDAGREYMFGYVDGELGVLQTA